MNGPTLHFTTTLEQLQEYSNSLNKEAFDEFSDRARICYAVHTCWWRIWLHHTEPHYTKSNLPCDPRGSMLLQAPIGRFLQTAEKNQAHYGKHGLLAFVAAYHGNVLASNGNPTSFDSWGRYNKLIERIDRKMTLAGLT
jgi:hypothetical protein